MVEGPRALTGRAIVSEAMALAGADEDQLELAVRQHARLVYRVAYSVLRNHHDAEDATQEVFVRVLRYRRKLAEVRDLRTWLARIAWRVALGRGRRETEVLLEDLPEAATRIRSRASGADELLLGSELTGVLGKLIGGLPRKLRDPLTLSTVEEMSPLDVAAVLGIREAVVRSRLFRARQILRQRLRGLLGDTYGA